jgi:hypothetical protein
MFPQCCCTARRVMPSREPISAQYLAEAKRRLIR